MDVPLSSRGQAQADALGDWLATSERPKPCAVLTSPYVRAECTAAAIVARSGLQIPCVLDERLREREFGALDRLTRAGIEQRYPDQAEARARVGKFYYRPPGGESWCDVALRVRSVLDTLGREYADEHVLIVSHQVVILMFRYVLERLTEAEVLAIGHEVDLANCSFTSFVASAADPMVGMQLQRFNEVLPVEDAGVPVTAESDVPVAPR
jgi:broad specificity phosphatase PhoE